MMNYFAWFFRWLAVYSTVTWHYSTAYNPLTFNPHTLEIYDPDAANSNLSNCSPCAIACPSQSEAEENIEEFTSRYRSEGLEYRYRSLFIQRITDDLQQLDTNRITCKRELQMDVMLHSKKGGKLVEFGFQIYFEKSMFESGQISSTDFYKFERIPNAESTIQRMHNWKKKYLTPPWSQVKSAIEKWGFVWLSKMQVRYDFSSRILISMRYKVRPIKLAQIKLTCYNYYRLNGTWYNTTGHLNHLYTNKQSEIFKKVRIPEGSCVSNGQLFQCLRRHNLVLPYQFQVPSQKEVSCSHITSIPLWNDIPAMLMYRMQLFLIAIAQEMGKKHELIVLPGILGQLTLPSVKDGKPVKIYLDVENRKVPVPKIIYKIVRHRRKECAENIEEFCEFDVVIVIHNYPEFTENERLCPTDECEKLGWASIQYLNGENLAEGKSPLVYCCELNADTAKSIAFPLGENENSPFNLRGVFMYDHNLQRRREYKFLGNVMREFEKLIEVKE